MGGERHYFRDEEPEVDIDEKQVDSWKAVLDSEDENRIREEEARRGLHTDPLTGAAAEKRDARAEEYQGDVGDALAEQENDTNYPQ